MRAIRFSQLLLAFFSLATSTSSSRVPRNPPGVCVAQPITSSITPAPSSTSSTPTTSVSATLTTSLPPALSAALYEPWDPLWQLDTSYVTTGEWGLPLDVTNGNSLLGSLKAPTYSPWNGGSGQSWTPWDNATTGGTNPYGSPPQTGVVRKYNFVIERATLAPDGVPKSVILINGAFPGPTIEANWGDTIQVTVTNNIVGPEEGVTLHWHGLLQRQTPFMDGIGGVSQCPIAPGQTWTYSFNADLYGTSWYHSHYSAQYVAGIFGPMIIHGPSDNAVYDTDLGPVIISDYYHDDYYTLVEKVMGTDLKQVVQPSDNNLINGKGLYNCSYAPDPATCNPEAGLSKFQFQSGKSYRIRLINAGGEAVQKFSIDGHKLQVIAYDFVPIVPYETEIVTLGVGQRADVVVTATGAPGSMAWMRSVITSCSVTNQRNALAMIYYERANTTAYPNTTAWEDNTNPCANDDLETAVPFYPITPPSDCEMELEVDINFGVNSTGSLVWTMNNSTFRTDYSNPVLPAILDGQSVSSFPTERNIYDLGMAKSIRVTINNLTPVVHPMHVHGHNMYVLSATSTRPTTLNTVHPLNPTRRDTQLLPPNGQIVIQIDGDNPGVWPLHCHIAWHVSAGLYVNLLERTQDVRGMPIPSSIQQGCQAWDAWTNREAPDQIDSGLRIRL